MIKYNNYLRIFLSSFLLLMSYLAVAFHLLDPANLFLMFTLLFIVLIWLEYKNSRVPFFTLPPAYFTAYMFANIFLSGIGYYSFGYKEFNQFRPADEFVVMGAWFTLLAVQILWVAFYMLPAKPFRTFAKLKFKSVPMRVVHGLVLIFIISFFVGVESNIFGYVADPAKINFVSYIRYGLSGGLIAITLMTIYYYDSRYHRLYLYVIIAVNMVVGLLFGSKSTIVMPLIIYVFTNYLCARRITNTAIAGFIMSIVIAYGIVEPFRIYYELYAHGQHISVLDLVELFVAARAYTAGEESNYLEGFIQRMSYVTALGKTVEYADLNSYYRTEEWGNLVLSPLYGAIPRFIWESKPLADFGLWASVNIFDLPATTHSGITPQGYSYLVGRIPGIILFFTLYGLIQRIGFNMFYLQKGLLPVFIYFYFFILFPSYPTWTAVSSYVQTSLIITVFLLLCKLRIGNVYSKSRQQKSDGSLPTERNRTPTTGAAFS